MHSHQETGNIALRAGTVFPIPSPTIEHHAGNISDASRQVALLVDQPSLEDCGELPHGSEMSEACKAQDRRYLAVT